jgi:murein DD-endopeptidase MepM/ murein hydrolase activator NlpD
MKLSNRNLLLTILIFLTFCLSNTAVAQDQPPTPHFVQPGDTWLALSMRYGLNVADIQSGNPHPNPLRQPAIGTTIQIPAPTTEPHPTGRIVHLFQGGLLSYAAAHNLNPWQVAIQNKLQSPYHPLTYQPLYIPGSAPLQELPAGFQSLELSNTPAQPGRAVAFRGQIDSAAPGSGAIIDTITVTIGTLSANTFTNDNHLVGLFGTGAFLSPGDYELTFLVGDNPLWSQPLRFNPGEWTFSNVTLTGEAAEIDAESIQQERERLFTIWNQATPTPQWTTPFQLPIESYLEITSLYGARRSYNGGPFASYHEGVDFSAYGGTPVYAPAAGTIVIAERLYVRGGAVIIDHGLGLYSGYYHLSEVIAEVGQTVEPGQHIGSVGTTGLSTGNHLHWDLLVGGVWVDAAAFQEQNLACWLLEGWGIPCI